MKSSKCQSCGFVGFSTTGACKRCGTALIERVMAVAPPRPNYAPAPPAPPRPNYAPAPPAPQGKKKGMAIFALVLGIVGFFSLGLLLVGAIVGIILAVIAMKKAEREPWIYGGRSLAIAALILNVTGPTLTVPFGIVLAIAIPNLMASARAANEGAAQSTLRTVSEAETNYQSITQRYGTWEELVSSNMIDPSLADGLRSGYRFTLEITKNKDNSEGFKVIGVPKDYGRSGVRSFSIDETGVLRAKDNRGRPSTALDPPVDSDYDSFRRTAYQDQ